MELLVIHRFLSDSYWSKNIPLETMKKAFQNSLCFGVLESENKQIGFARMITDKTTFAYLADVFILENYRGRGISKLLMKTILEHQDLQGLRRMVLATSDAHGLYKKFGFTALANPRTFMELWESDVYSE
jgi:N-acetylglutamate synthase-like GNAT family acetyltransferase